MTTPTDAAAKAREIVAICREHISGDEFVHLSTWKELEIRFSRALLAYGDERAREAREKAIDEVTIALGDVPCDYTDHDGCLTCKCVRVIRALKGKS
jgi:hypothetical protein